MYLKSLEINGFKSFSNKVNIDFTKGITSIVGPNGSGKSNILDAVLWVLGEQSYKSIRAKDSTDVIFSGGKNKKARSNAYVSLCIDNSDRYIEYDSDELIISRHISRDGEGSYSLNGKKVRLKDINSLLMDTGIGKQAYSVIGQGKVERIISSSSQELRNIIDEAAGIKKAKIEKEQANKRLITVETEVDKIEYVEKELKRRVEELEKDSKKARIYVSYNKEIKALKYMSYNFQYKYNKKEITKISTNIEKLNEDIENIDIQINQYLLDIKEKENRKQEIEKELDYILNANNINDEKLKELKEKELLYINKKANFNADLQFKNSEKDRLHKIIQQYKTELDNIEKEKKIYIISIETKEKEKKEIENLILENNNKKIQIENSIKEAEEKYKHYEVDKIKLTSSNAELEKRINQANIRNKQITEEKKLADKKLNNLLKNNEINKNFLDISKELEVKKVEKRKLQQRYEELITKKVVIKNNLENYKLLNSAIQYIQKESKNDEKIYGPFVSMIDVDEKYQLAISIIAGSSLSDIVVKDSKTARKYIDLLKQSKIGTVSFLPIENLVYRPIVDKGYNYARNIVRNISGNKEIDKIINYIFSNTVIVDDMKQGLELSKTCKDKIVTLEGDVISSTGRITGGYIRKKVDENLVKKQELQQIEKELSTLIKKLEQYSIILNDLEVQKNILYEFEESKKNILREIETYNYEINENNEFIQEKTKEIELNIEAVNNINKNIVANEENKEKLLNILATFTDNEDKKEELSKLKVELAVIIEKKSNIEKLENEKLILYNDSNENYNNIINFLDKKDEIFSNIEKELNLIKFELERINDDNISSKDKIAQLNKEHITISKLITDSINQKFEVEINKNNMNNKLENLNKELFQKENEVQKFDYKLKELEQDIEEIKSYYDYKEIIDAQNLKIIERKISISEKSILELGDVNISSIQEYEVEKNRYEKLMNDKFDLIKSKDSILSLILDIDNEIKVKFNDAIENISKNFEYMCKELLNGAKAKISILDIENLIETGLELKVKYKNKPEQSLTLLSGGEKSMLAVAFIMAIFMYKPSPFTFFDEVEAALDDANTKKLINLLKTFTYSQFILITHNKETMKGSDRLYGVTMNKEIGESVIVSVDI